LVWYKYHDEATWYSKTLSPAVTDLDSYFGYITIDGGISFLGIRNDPPEFHLWRSYKHGYPLSYTSYDAGHWINIIDHDFVPDGNFVALIKCQDESYIVFCNTHFPSSSTPCRNTWTLYQ